MGGGFSGTVMVPGCEPTFAGTTTFGGMGGNPGNAQLVMLQATLWWLVKVMEVAPELIVPPAQTSIV